LKEGQPGPLLVPTFRARVDGQWTILLARRVEDASGNFSGVVVAAIDPQYLASRYAALDLGPRAAIALMYQDDIILVPYPWAESRIGKPIEAFHLHAMLETAKTGTDRSISTVDRVDRLYGYAALDGFSLVIRTVLDTSVILDEWWRYVYV